MNCLVEYASRVTSVLCVTDNTQAQYPLICGLCTNKSQSKFIMYKHAVDTHLAKLVAYDSITDMTHIGTVDLLYLDSSDNLLHLAQLCSKVRKYIIINSQACDTSSVLAAHV